MSHFSPLPPTSPSLRRPLLSSCAIAAIAVAAVHPAPVLAQGFQGTAPSSGPGFNIVDSPNVTTVNITSPKVIITWDSAAENFLPNGNKGIFQGTGSAYTVLNRISPADATRPIQFNGTVESKLSSTAPVGSGGNIWFYSPSGILVGATGRFDVGGLLLTANNLTDPDFLGTDPNFRFTAANPGASVEISPGAQLNALGPNSYVALIAPRVRQGGAVTANGSAVYVGGEQVDVTINGTLFDISFAAGGGSAFDGSTAGNAAVEHDGTTTLTDTDSFENGYGIPVPGGARTAILTTVPKNDAVTMLVSGSFDYVPAASAIVVDNRIILSGGYNVENGFTAVRADATGIADVRITNASFDSDVTSLATHSISAAATGTGALTFGGFASLTAPVEARLDLAAGRTATVAGDLRLDASNVDASAGVAAIGLAAGSLLDVNGNIIVAADAIGETYFGGDPAPAIVNTGRAEVIVTGGTLQVDGSLVVSANASGASAETIGGDATAGTAIVSIGAGGGSISVGGSLSVTASAFGGQPDESGYGGPADSGGSAQGGIATLTAGGGTINVVNSLDVRADARGGDSFQEVGYGGGTGGSAVGGSVSVSTGGGQITIGSNANVTADAIGGEGATTAGAAQGGSATLSSAAGGGGRFRRGINLSATGQGGLSDGVGGAAAGGTVLLDTAGGTLGFGDPQDPSYGFLGQATVSASASGGEGRSGGGNAAGGNATVRTATGGSISTTAGISVSARGDGGNSFDGAGSSATGGSAIMLLAGTDASLGFLDLDASARGGFAGEGFSSSDGGAAQGGTARLTIAGGNISANQLRVVSYGDGGGGNENFGGGDGGNGGAGTGGTAQIDIDAGTVNANRLFVSATATGGSGGYAYNEGPIGIGGSGGAATAGTALLRVGLAGGTPNVDVFDIDVFAEAFGGSGGYGFTGGAGGRADGGEARVTLAGGLVFGGFDLSAEARGGSGGQTGGGGGQDEGIAGDGGDAIGGAMTLETSAGSNTGAFFINLDARAQGGFSDAQAGNGSGGTATLTVGGGSTVTIGGEGGAYLDVRGAGGGGGFAGVGNGGDISVAIDGRLSTGGSIELLADGFGGTGAQAGGGVGGTIAIGVSGNLDIGTGGEGGSLLASAAGGGGFAFEGGYVTPTFGYGDGIGGDIELDLASSGLITIAGAVTLFADGAGFSTCIFCDPYQGQVGGNGTGGTVTATLRGSIVFPEIDENPPEVALAVVDPSFPILRLSARGTGGSGGEQLGATGPNGGDGIGGTVSLTIGTETTGGVPNISIDVTGRGGDAGPGFSGEGGCCDGNSSLVSSLAGPGGPVIFASTPFTGAGGDGVGGTVTVIADGSSVAVPSIDVLAPGIGGRGADGSSVFDGSGVSEGGKGGDGTGGSITLRAQNGGELRLLSSSIDVTGLGGDGGNGAEAGYGAATIAGSGGIGGIGRGGAITLATIDGSIVIEGGLGFEAAGIGGEGGFGGYNDGDSGYGSGYGEEYFGGAGGDGGAGFGGIVAIDIAGGFVNGPTNSENGGVNSLTISVLGQGGNAGLGGGSSTGQSLGDGTGGDGTGGRASISVADGATPGVGAFGATTITASGLEGDGVFDADDTDGNEFAGSVSIADNAVGDAGGLSFDSLLVNVGGANRIGQTEFTLTSVQGPIRVAGASTFNISGEASFAAANSGGLAGVGPVSVFADVISVTHTNASAGAATIAGSSVLLQAGAAITGGSGIVSGASNAELISGGFIDVGTLRAGNDALATAATSVSIVEADAGRGVIVNAGGPATIATATAGDDIRVSAGGPITLTSGTTTGLGEDVDESGYGADGSNIRLRGGGAVRLDDGSAINLVELSSNNGAVLSDGTISGQSLFVSAATDIDVNDLVIDNTIDLFAGNGFIDGNSFTSGGSVLLRASETIAVAGIVAAEDISLSADGNVNVGDATAGGAFFAEGQDIALGNITTTGAFSGEGGNGITVFANRTATMVSADSASFIEVAGTSFSGGSLAAADFIRAQVSSESGGTGDIATGNATAGSFISLSGDGDVTTGVLTAGQDVGVDAGGSATIGGASAGRDLRVDAATTIGFGALASVGDTWLTGGSISFESSSITAGGNATLNGAITVEGPATISAGLQAVFNGAVNGSTDTTTDTLGVTTGTGTIFASTIGATTALQSLAVNGPASLNGASITTVSNQNFGGSVTLAGAGTARTFTSTGGGAIAFGGGLNGGYAVAVNTSGATSFAGPIGSINALTSLTTDAGGTTSLAAAINTTGAQVYGDAALLTADTLLTSGGGNITFASTLNGARALTVNTGGTLRFGGAVGGTTALTSLTTDAGGTTAIDGGAITTSGNQSYGDTVALGANTILTGASGTFAGGLTGNGRDLALNFTGTTALSSLFAGVRNLSTGNGGTTTLAGTIATSGTQTYNDVVVLTGDTIISSTGAGAAGNVVFAAAVNGAQALTVNTTGVTRFGAAVGGTTALASLSTNAGGSTELGGGSVTTSGSQAYGDVVVLLADTVLTGTGGSFANGVTGNNRDLALNFSGTTALSGTFSDINDLSTGNGGTTTLTGIITTSGSQSYSDAVLLAGTAQLDAGGDIIFGSTVDGNQRLFASTTGSLRFVGAVGSTTALDGLVANVGGDIGFATIVSDNDIFFSAGGSISGTSIAANDGIGFSAQGAIDVGTASAASGDINLSASGDIALDSGTAGGAFFAQGQNIALGDIVTTGAFGGEGGNGITLFANGTASLASADSASFIDAFGISFDGGDLVAADFIRIGADSESGGTGNITTGNAAAGSFVSLSGDGDVATGVLTAGEDVLVGAGGSATLAGAGAGRDVLVDAGGTITLVSAQAGDDIELSSLGGSVTLLSGTTTGLGEDSDESGYGTGDGSNIRLAGAGAVRLDTGTAIDTVELTSSWAAVLSDGTITANNLSVSAATDIALNDLVINDAITLTAETGDVTGGDFTTNGAIEVAAGGDIDIDSATASGPVTLTAAGDVAALSLVSLSAIRASGGNLTLGSMRAGGGIVLDAAGSIVLADARAAGDFLADADGSFTGGTVTTVAGGGGGNQNQTGIRANAADPDGNGISIASVGALTLGVANSAGGVILQSANGAVRVTTDLIAAGPVDAFGQSVSLNAIGALAIRSAQGTAGDVALTSGGDLTVQQAQASAAVAATSGGTLALNGGINGAQISLVSRNIAIGSGAQVGTATGTQSIAITANGGTAPVLIGGTAAGTGYTLDSAEFGRLAARDISFAATGGGPLQIGALSVRGAGAASPNVGRNLSISGTGAVNITGRVAVENANAQNALSIGSGGQLFADLAGGGVAVLDGSGGLIGTLELRGNSILVSTAGAATDVQNATSISARDARLGTNDGAVNEAGVIRAGAIRLVASDSIRVQNTGGNDTPDARAGLFAGAGGITLVDSSPTSPLEIIINGRQSINGSTVTGQALIARLTLQSGSGTFTPAAGSTVNGCLFGGAPCGVVEPAIFEADPMVTSAVADVIDEVEEDIRPNIVLSELISVEQAILAPIIDEPVTGTGNEDVYYGFGTGDDDDDEDEDETDQQVTGSGNETLSNQPAENREQVTGAGNEATQGGDGN